MTRLAEHLSDLMERIVWRMELAQYRAGIGYQGWQGPEKRALIAERPQIAR